MPKNSHIQQNNNNNTYTYGTIIGHSPHPPTCVWVGWVFFLGLGSGVFVITFILCFIFSFIFCVVHIKYSICILHHIHYIWQFPNSFQFSLHDMVYAVVVVSIVHDDLVETAL